MSGRSPCALGSVNPSSSASATAWIAVKCCAARLSILYGLLAVETMEQFPTCVGEIEERLSVRCNQKAFVIADLQLWKRSMRRSIGGP